MRFWSLALIVLLSLVLRADGCGSSGTPLHQGEHPCGFDKDNPAIVLFCPDTPTPSPTPTPNPDASVTPLANDAGKWAGKLSASTTQIRKAYDKAASANPNYASDPTQLANYAHAFAHDVALPVGGMDGLLPTPPGLEAQYRALDSAAHALTVALANPIDAHTVDGAYVTYVDACGSVQQYFDANNIDSALQCAGELLRLSAGDFFAAVAPIVATMHTSADAAQSTFDALSPSRQADGIALTSYGGGVGNAYGKAAQSIGLLTPPAALAPLQQSFNDAASAVFDAGQQVEFDVKSITDPVGLPAEVTTAKSTFGPLQAAVETACRQLQSAAQSAGVSTDLGCRS